KRRFNYAFTNCTNCGPRFTIIKKLPYDRQNTTMADFLMCPECRQEYDNPQDRRFHAQPNACIKCGPQLQLTDNEGRLLKNIDPLKYAVRQLKNGKIIGIKSLGGFQIACDATSDNAVQRLRKSKNRPYKPFALMFKNMDHVKMYFKTNSQERELLSSQKAPIVLLKKKKISGLTNEKEIERGIFNLKQVSKYVSFNNKYEGVMLPYSPLHHLIFKEINFPLIMTSGNISEEPIAYENDDAVKKLKSICDFFLINNRDIYSRFDDSVVKIFKKREMILRRARGYAPYPVKLELELKNKTVLAIGSEEKNTFCLIRKNYAIISQHIGDIDNEYSIDFFKSALKNYRSLFNIDKIDLLVFDKHPAFRLNSLALNEIKSENKISIQHHKAHIASVIAENNIKRKVLGFAWDGTGYGDDGKIWGSEIFVADEKLNFERIGHLTEKILPGGEVTIRKPYRMAITYIYYSWIRSDKNNFLSDNKSGIGVNKKADAGIGNLFLKYFRKNFSCYAKIVEDREILSIVFQIESGFNSIKTTSMGRLFDAVSSVLKLTNTATFEGEAAINLEMIAKENCKDFYNFKYTNENPDMDNYKKNRKFIVDDIDLFLKILKDISSGKDFEKISAGFHNTLSEIILDISKKIRENLTINDVVLSGGVFQNNYLIEKTFKLLENEGFNVYTNFKVPVNDGGISLGQAYLGMKNMT
ncbi:MAG: carbamoyltransferase HypF, partial [Actinobacteria bacterium]|nr:carbamoyltransferase HypF [Actinomycetota bacterium]